MANQEDEKLEKRRQKEKRELARLEMELARPQKAGYLYYLIFILCIIYITDEVATQIGTQMQSVIAQSLFAPIFGADVAVARMGALGMITMIGTPLSIMYKPLSDRYGRRIFLIINTLGMGAGLFFISISTGIPVYLLGTFLIGFFIPHDVQAVYILESVSSKWRASFYSGIKAVATLGMILIPLLRQQVMGTDITKWRGVYLIPAIVAAAVSVLALFAVRETIPYLKKRIEYLHLSDEARTSAKSEKGAEQAQGGVIPAIRFVMRHKQLKWLLIGGGFIMWGIAITMYYETTMTYGYAAQFMKTGMDFEQASPFALPFVTQALFMFPIGSAFFQLIQGFIADKLGRKPTIIIMCACAISCFTTFYIGANNNWNPYVVGLLCGSAIGSYWAALDLAGGIMCSESTPTNMRASVLTVQPFLSGVFCSVALIGALIAINVLGDAFSGIISIVIAIPGMLVGMLVILLKTRETRGVNLDEITGREE